MDTPLPESALLAGGLSELRRSRGLSLAQAAELGKVSKSALAHWEAGRRTPSGAILGGVLDALGAPARTKAALLAAADPRHARIVLADSSGGFPPSTGEALRAMRLRRGLGQSELARMLDLPQNTISRWESGDVRPGQRALHEALFALGANMEEVAALAATEGRSEPRSDPHGRFRALFDAPTALGNLLWLGLEAELWWRASRSDEWDDLLHATVARRAQSYAMLGRWDEAATTARRALGAPLRSGELATAPAGLALVEAQAHLGTAPDRLARSLAAWVERAPSPAANSWPLSTLALALASAGEGRAVDLATLAIERADHRNDAEYRRLDLAEVHLRLDDPESALEALEGNEFDDAQPIRARSFLMMGEEPPEPVMASVRSHPAATVPLYRDRQERVERAYARFCGRRRKLYSA